MGFPPFLFLSSASSMTSFKPSIRSPFCRKALGITLIGISAIQAEPVPVPLTIENLVVQTLARNPEIKFYNAEIAVAKAGRKTAGRFANPELDLELGHKRASGGDATAEGIAYSVALAQPIEWPGRLGLRKAIADRDIALAELGLEQFRYFLSSRVKLLGYSLATQQENAAAAAEVADRITSVKEVIVQREPGGVAPLLEAKILEATELTVQRKASEAAVEMQKALLELNQLMGRRADSPLQVKRTEYDSAKPTTLAALLNQAAQTNYALRVRRAELEQQGLKIALSENERYPTFTVGPSVSHESAGDRETVIGLSLSMPLPVWDDGRAAVSASQARRMQAEASLQATFREVEREITEAWLILETQRKRLGGWKPETLATFSEAAQLADRHYRLGAVPISTYIEMQDKYLEATEAINATRLEVLQASLALQQLIGSTSNNQNK
jgi:cobalt-zinc-cadmium efflux system outer membrane protein